MGVMSNTTRARDKRNGRRGLWSDQETDYLRNHNSVSVEDMAVALGRTTTGIRSRAAHIGIPLKVIKRAALKNKPAWAEERSNDGGWRWSPQETQFLKENAGTLSVEELADKLRRSEGSVRGYVGKHRISLAKPCRVCGGKIANNRTSKRVCCDECRPKYKVVMESVLSHHYSIFSSQREQEQRTYKGMPFFDGWNPDKGGSFLTAVLWIIENLGARPEGSTLHVIPQTMKGFVPGNLMWTGARNQSIEQHYKIIGRQDHQIKQLEAEKAELSNKVRELEARLISKPEEIYLEQAA
jgi:hypothetical protein